MHITADAYTRNELIEMEVFILAALELRIPYTRDVLESFLIVLQVALHASCLGASLMASCLSSDAQTRLHCH